MSGDGGRDPLEEILALFTPEKLLAHPRATGQGVRVAILDSGIERSLLELEAARRGQMARPIEGVVFLPGQQEPRPDQGRASSPHGTTVADILLRTAPGVELYSADIFGPRGTCEVDVLLRALTWAMDVAHCKIINLSLGIAEAHLPQIPQRYRLLRAIEEAYFRDVLIVAAAHNDHPLTRSFPAQFAPALLSVDKKTFVDPHHFGYCLREQIEFQAHDRGHIGPFASEAATSWAVPRLSGIAARLLSLKPDMKVFELKTILYWLSKHFPADAT